METNEETITGSSLGVTLALGAAVIAVILSVFALGRALAGDSGGDGGGGGGGGPSSVDVTLTEFEISPATINVAEGDGLNVTNDGTATHNLKLRDGSLGTADLNAGDAATLDLSSLAAGSHDIFCSIAGHAEAGMTGTLVVGGEAGEDPGAALTGAARAEWLRANYEASVAAFPAETEAIGNQVMEPEVLADGTKVFELTIDETRWEVAPGEFVDAIAYNGMVPGPTIKIDVGDRVTIRLVNSLDDQATTIHPHGIFMHPFEVDGVGYVSHDPTMPGETYEVTFVAKEPSVGMYHGHDNGVEQVINGAFGAWLVGDIWDFVDLPAEVNNIVGERVMVLNDAGEVGLTLNAKSFPATEPYVLKKGEQLVMHYYNEGLTAHPMHLHNNAQLVIAKDGYPLAQPYHLDTLNVAPGERYTVVIFAEAPGVWVYHCHILTHVERDDGSVFGMFTALIVEDSGDAAVDADTSRTAGNGRNGAPSEAATEPADDATS